MHERVGASFQPSSPDAARVRPQGRLLVRSLLHAHALRGGPTRQCALCCVQIAPIHLWLGAVLLPASLRTRSATSAGLDAATAPSQALKTAGNKMTHTSHENRSRCAGACPRVQEQRCALQIRCELPSEMGCDSSGSSSKPPRTLVVVARSVTVPRSQVPLQASPNQSPFFSTHSPSTFSHSHTGTQASQPASQPASTQSHS